MNTNPRHVDIVCIVYLPRHPTPTPCRHSYISAYYRSQRSISVHSHESTRTTSFRHLHTYTHNIRHYIHTIIQYNSATLHVYRYHSTLLFLSCLLS